MPLCPARLATEEEFTEEDRIGIADQRRAWQVRKYCQARPPTVRYSLGDDPQALNGTADAAMTALLRGILKQLDADIAMISLLDEHTQFFLSGATKNDCNDGQITLESAQWYGCNEVSHHGGLCERTITLPHLPDAPAFYEVLDMANTKHTQNLPFINGTIADYRHYAGMPISSPEGVNIGTVFIMSRTPSTNGITYAQRTYLYESTRHVMAQLVLSIQALEGKRAERYSEGLSTLLNDGAYNYSKQPRDIHRVSSRPAEVTGVYRKAGELLHDFLDLSGLIFQEVPLAGERIRGTPDLAKDTIIYSKLESDMPAIVPLERSAVHNMLEVFGHGGVLHVDETSYPPVFAEATNYDRNTLSQATTASLNRSFPGARQIIFTPLWDAVHNRATTLCIGWVLDDRRVFRPETDLVTMSSFCMATMSLALRLESKLIEQVKADFLGSISHEMRSPLHNVLGNLQLALATDCSSEVRDMLTNASDGATQLLENIDKLLLHSRVQAQPSAISTSQPMHLSSDLVTLNHNVDQDLGYAIETDSTSGDANLLDLCEEVVESVTKRTRFSEPIFSPSVERKGDQQSPYGFYTDVTTASENDCNGIVTFDARSSDNCQLKRKTEVRIILENLLSNAIKFTRSGYCVRISLKLDTDYCHLEVTDCGRGFSPDFIQHSLFVPFSQQEPTDSGVGLGLSLVKRNVEILEGQVHLETDEALGSKVAISLPVSSMAACLDQKTGNGITGQGGLAVTPPMPIRAETELPVLKASIYAPRISASQDRRDERSFQLLFESLAHNLATWFQPKITLWQEDEGESPPQLIFIAQQDVGSFQKSSWQTFAEVKKVVVATRGHTFEHDSRKAEADFKFADAVISGPLLPSKLWEAAARLFPRIIPSRDDGRETEEAFVPGILPQSNGRVSNPAGGNSVQPLTLGDGQQADQDFEETTTILPDRSARNAEHGLQNTNSKGKGNFVNGEQASDMRDSWQTNLGDKSSRPGVAMQVVNADRASLIKDFPARQGHPQPPVRLRILLVDDNSVNLKMLSMFVQKSGIPADDISQASGGQEAIERYKEALGSQGAPEAGFDMIFMDLSMPQVSGFEATSAIRRIEEFRGGKTAYIAALTGLVSDKDRQAAEAAGTNEYITKPAGLVTIQTVIDRWRTRAQGFARLDV